MRRRITLIVLLLVGGAIVNVAVAWGCAMRSWSFFGEPSEIQISDWPRLAPSGFAPAQRLSTDGKLGFRQVVASAEGKTRYLESEWPGFGAGDKPFWIQSVNQCGLPCLSLEWMMHYPADPSAMSGWQIGGIAPPTWIRDSADLSKRLAYEPIWPGFAFNTIFYAAILWLLFFAPGALRRTIRRRRGLCPACAYPIGTSPVCTECGTSLLRH
jgi:hypothetical protein